MVVYDITDDRLRERVALTLMEYGFSRVQRSVFVGDVSRNVAEMLAIELRRLVEGSPCDLRIIPVCARCYMGVIIVARYGEPSEAEREVVVT